MTAGLRSTIPGRLPATRDRGPAGAGPGDAGSARGEVTPAAVLALATAAPELVGPGDIDTLQRTVGNRAVVEVLQRQRVPRVRAPTHDETAAELGGLGGPYASYDDFVATMVDATFLGHRVARGVRPEFRDLLATAQERIDEEYATAGRQPPPGYDVNSIGGFRRSAGFHAWGLAIDIDVSRNPFVMHEAGERDLDRQLAPVYHRIAEFVLNQPVGTEQSIVPAIITGGGGMTATSPTGRRERVAEYYDRLLLESQAMEQYFALMRDPTALAEFLAGTWTQRHPGATAPDAADTTRQMWQDYATLGGAVPRGGPPGIPGFTPPAAAGGDRPFNPRSAGQQDPGLGFLTIPREVVIGLGRALSRWGAIDFGGESGDIQHFDDGNGLGRTVSSAKRAVRRRLEAQAAAEAAATTSAQGGAAAGATAQPLRAVQPFRTGQPLRAVQRRTEPGEGSDEGGVLVEAGPAPLTEEQRRSGAHWKQIADDRWGGATPDIAELESSFGSDLTAFLDMLAANNITYVLESAYRPPERSYLFHYCVKVWKRKIAPKDVPPMAGVDIVWDHGNDAASRAGAEALANAFGLVGVAAHPSNHNAGTAVDMKLDFSGNATNTLTYTKNGKTITRRIKTDDEARVGVKAKGKSIANIEKRELSKAGADFGVKRKVDSDIVHWSRTGR
ncbi:MAG TPA: hypothetical protein VFO78_13320 [Candidatus Limnocylindrales bacterium]|nr:hypothetical protein [Candidatus Limnocylindrales bacterium]